MIKKIIPLSVPNLKGQELFYVKKCVETEWVSTAGKFAQVFENKIANFTGAKYAISCINGTAALQIALQLAGVKENDEVIVPSLTFIAPVNAIKYNGACPIFMDNNEYFTLDSKKTVEFIKKQTFLKNGYSYNKRTKKRISAIIPVHVWGNAVWLDDLIILCKQRNINIVEDASESLGTKYSKGNFKNKHTGTIGKLGCLSFNGNKIITTGGGGMILTNNKKIANKAYYLTTQAKDNSREFIHNSIGYNFRLPNILSALGVAQMKQLSKFLKIKRNIYKNYVNEFKNSKSFSISPVPNYSSNNHWLNILKIKGKKTKKIRDKILKYCKIRGINLGLVWFQNHEQIPYIKCQRYKVTNAKKMINSSLCLPSSSNLTKKDLKYVCRIINKI